MPSSNFLFIEVQQTGKVPPRRDVRTAIQKHVMRDIGVARRGQPRPQRQLENVRDCKKHDASLFRNIAPKTHPEKHPIRKVHTKAITSAQELAYTGPSAKVPWLVSGGCRTDPFACFPIHMTSETSFLIDYLLVSSEPRLQPIKETWLPMSLSDPALFYEILSHISRDITASFPGYAKEKQAFALHSQALQSVNKRLSDPVESVSDGIIATILGFACFSLFDRDWTSYDMHIEGLRTIITLKGGVHAIDHDRILRLLLSGIDVSASCFTGQPPKFPLPISTLSELRDDEQEIPWWFPHPSVNESSIWSITFPHDPTLAEIFKDLSITSMAIKSELKKRLLWQDQSFLKTWVDPLTHRLLDGGVELKDIDETNFVNESCRLGALILLSKIRRRFGARLVFTEVETERLRTLLEINGEGWTSFKKMLLWTAILAALETDNEDRLWFCDIIGNTAKAMDLQGWDEIIVHASNLLWVGDVLDKECDNLRPLVHME
ncbi:hypothetical protein DM02DRAFT_653959 [Periconia macrospinosa]|uniref:Uncharacterized protein n=1 Tax=Periconia macrospinosa TaxID=97972 RepID=A0A2V1DV19_9PLEO|nr:hypothetical protein DM02DRAFT_653959 [Periconia macrospinosa]